LELGLRQPWFFTKAQAVEVEHLRSSAIFSYLFIDETHTHTHTRNGKRETLSVGGYVFAESKQSLKEGATE